MLFKQYILYFEHNYSLSLLQFITIYTYAKMNESANKLGKLRKNGPSCGDWRETAKCEHDIYHKFVQTLFNSIELFFTKQQKLNIFYIILYDMIWLTGTSRCISYRDGIFVGLAEIRCRYRVGKNHIKTVGHWYSNHLIIVDKQTWMNLL